MPVLPAVSLRSAISLLVCLFPVLSSAIQGGGSLILLILFLTGLVLGWPAWRELTPVEKRWLWSIVIFLAAVALAYINTEDWPEAISKIERFIRIGAIIPVYLLIRRYKPALLLPSLIGAALAVTVLFVQAQLEFANNSDGVSGAYNRIIFGDLTVLYTSWLVLGLILFRQPKYRILVAVLIAMGLYATMASVSRNAWFFVPVFILLLLFLYRKQITTKRWQVIGLSGLLVIGLFSLWTPRIVTEGVNRGVDNIQAFLNNPNARSRSWGTRIKLWHDSVLMFMDHPLIGVGVGDFMVERKRLLDSGRTYAGIKYGHAHNLFLHALATTGLLGLIALCMALFVMPWKLLYSFRLEATGDPWRRYAILGGLLSLAGFVHFGLSETWLARVPFVNVYALSCVIFIAALFNQADHPSQNSGTQHI